MSVEPDGPPADNAVAAGSTDSDGGVMVEFAEEEYLYGLGVLRLRVTRVTRLRLDPGWVLVDGIRIDHRGDPRERRAVMITAAAMRRHGLERI
jgi:hypothetical protein